MGRDGSAGGVAALYRSPETVNKPPATNRAAGEMGQVAASATSSGAPMRRKGIAASIRSRGRFGNLRLGYVCCDHPRRDGIHPDSLRADSVVIQDSVEWIVWAVPAGNEGAPVEVRGARQDNRLFLSRANLL